MQGSVVEREPKRSGLSEMLDCVNDKDAELFVLQRCWMECLLRLAGLKV